VRDRSSSAEAQKLTVVAHSVGPYGGQEQAIEQFVLSTASTGQPVRVVAFKVSKSVLTEAEFVRVPSVAGPFVLRFIWFWIYSTFVIGRNPQSVITCGAITAVPVAAIWLHYWHEDHLRKTGWVCAWQGSIVRFLNQTIARWVALLAEIWSIRVLRGAILVAVSDDLASELRKTYPLRTIEVLANPVGTAGVQVPRAPDSKPTVLFVGGEWGRKGLVIIARASSKVARERRTHVRLVIVGKGQDKVVAKIRSLPYLIVERTTWTDDVAPFFANAHVLALASSYETFAMGGHEALGSGLPVVTTNVYGLGAAVRATGHGAVADRSVRSLTVPLDRALFGGGWGAQSPERAATWIDQHYGAASIESQRKKMRRILLTGGES
jgi:glycosyltransferase involved in cell wall biosynthesis